MNVTDLQRRRLDEDGYVVLKDFISAIKSNYCAPRYSKRSCPNCLSCWHSMIGRAIG